MKVVNLFATLLAGCLCVSAAVPPGVVRQKLHTGFHFSKTSALPFVFEENAGQAPSDVDFIGRASNGTVLLKRTGVVLLPRDERDRTVTLSLSGAKTARPE